MEVPVDAEVTCFDEDERFGGVTEELMVASPAEVDVDVVAATTTGFTLKRPSGLLVLSSLFSRCWLSSKPADDDVALLLKLLALSLFEGAEGVGEIPREGVGVDISRGEC